MYSLASEGWTTRKTWAWPPEPSISSTWYLPIRRGSSIVAWPSIRDTECLAHRPRGRERASIAKDSDFRAVYELRLFVARERPASDPVQQAQDVAVSGDRIAGLIPIDQPSQVRLATECIPDIVEQRAAIRRRVSSADSLSSNGRGEIMAWPRRARPIKGLASSSQGR